ncbi:GNAT family N-acetyltransferase [Paenibacillus mendelii]|uniref:GNAT family N-acetyltransferase n=1 Tax=Paenibacillus mendelii TaxID=206163 RepID=A0ABV6JLK6_9BACL|nr:GNAT family N-acetyltransferase [Paenibacillus mendelii]MCQ6563061.1 GNAT family N-acetyltransferase [Paenibacillus mendelii]
MQPTFETERLCLRPWKLTDASSIRELAGSKEVAATTLSIPHPYPEGAAESWIDACHHRSAEGNGYSFAITSKDQHTLLGCISLNVSKPHRRGELAYWLGRAFWCNGFATEAAKQIVHFGFHNLHLNKIHAAAMTKNPASSNVMIKVGMEYEGTFKQHIMKWDVYEDLVYYGLVRADYEKRNG